MSRVQREKLLLNIEQTEVLILYLTTPVWHKNDSADTYEIRDHCVKNDRANTYDISNTRAMNGTADFYNIYTITTINDRGDTYNISVPSIRLYLWYQCMISVILTLQIMQLMAMMSEIIVSKMIDLIPMILVILGLRLCMILYHTHYTNNTFYNLSMYTNKDCHYLISCCTIVWY